MKEGELMSFWGWVLYIYCAACYYGMMIFMGFAVVAGMYFRGREAFSPGSIFLFIVMIFMMIAMTRGYFGWLEPELRYVETAGRQKRARMERVMEGKKE